MTRRLLRRLLDRVSTRRPVGLPGELAQVQAYLAEVQVDRLLGRCA